MFISLEFHSLIGTLKQKPRKGWVNREIPNPETIDQHAFRSTFIARDFARVTGEDYVGICELMLNHDNPEIGAGDITPHCGISNEDKFQRELESAHYLAGLSGDQTIIDLFLEYEEKKTRRACLGNDADKLEAVLQAVEYAWKYPEKRAGLYEFLPYAHDRLLTDVGKRYFDGLEKLWAIEKKPQKFPVISL